mgnify:CR=1 FL=1
MLQKPRKTQNLNLVRIYISDNTQDLLRTKYGYQRSILSMCRPERAIPERLPKELCRNSVPLSYENRKNQLKKTRKSVKKLNFGLKTINLSLLEPFGVV